MHKSEPHQLTIEKTPAYYHKGESAKLIHTMNSTIKILLVMREPVARAVSEYVQWDMLDAGKEKPFEVSVVEGIEIEDLKRELGVVKGIDL